jgi:hypothetical protein
MNKGKNTAISTLLMPKTSTIVSLEVVSPISHSHTVYLIPHIVPATYPVHFTFLDYNIIRYISASMTG